MSAWLDLSVSKPATTMISCAINQFRVDPPGALGDRGFIVPDLVLFVNGIPLVVIEAKSPAVTDPLATAIDQLRRYANRRVADKNEGAERLFWTNQLLDPDRLLRRTFRLRHRAPGRFPPVAGYVTRRR